MASQYYLIPLQYDIYPFYTIFKTNGGSLFDLKSNGFIKRLVNIPKDWLQLSEEEALFLLSKKLTERMKMYNKDVFYKIRHLHVNDTCYYCEGDKRTPCTIMAILYVDDAAGFRVMTSDNRQCDVSAYDIVNTIEEISQPELLEEIFYLLLLRDRDIECCDDNGRSVLTVAYELHNKNYFKALLSKYDKKLEMNNDIVQSVLHSIINNKHWELLILMLDKCNVQECDNDILLQLSIWALKQGNNEFLGIIFKFLSKINTMPNGETFLTNLFKEDLTEKAIKNVVEMKLFDLNVSNDKDETPLTLACDKLMPEVVRSLLQNGSDGTFRNYSALQIVDFAKTYHPFKEKEANQIKEMIINHTTNVTTKKKIPSIKTINNVVKTRDELQQKQKISQIDLLSRYTGFEDQRIEKAEKTLIRIMISLMTNNGDLSKMNTKNECVFYLAYSMNDKRFYNIFMQSSQQKLDFMASVIGQYILSKIIDDEEMKIFKNTLDICVLEGKYDDVILTLALRSLILNMQDYWKMISEKCTNINIIMKNNETFLTSLVKENVDPKLILNVLSSNLFDVNKINGINETMLMLACEKLLTEVVEVLLKNGADLSHTNYRAVDLLVINGNKPNDSNVRIVAKNNIMNFVCNGSHQNDKSLNFLRDNIIDLRTVTDVTEFISNLRIGDPVTVNTDMSNILCGEIKWMGIINGENCVGIDLEDKYQFGMDGNINGFITFECAKNHGIVTTLKNVTKNSNVLHTPSFTEDGFIDPNKYIRSKEFWNYDILKEKDIKKDDVVNVNISTEMKISKMKGILKWCGTMNGEYVAVVELSQEYKSGTNGIFWRQQIIQCTGKRAIAASFDDISKYIPFQKKQIPNNEKIFEDIDINSKVIYYKKDCDIIKFVHGIVRWCGVDEYNSYMYGIELNEKDEDGTDGTFNNMRLFQCKPYHGVVVPMKMIEPDTRFSQKKIVNGTILSSNKSELKHYCIPNKYFRGNNYGIQSNDYSTFVASIIFALFSKSHILDFIISPVNNNKHDYTIKKIKNVMSWNIVYPLRENGYVSFNNLKLLNTALSKSGLKLGNILKKEIDLPSLATLFAKLSFPEQLLRLVSFQNTITKSFYLQLCKTPDIPVKQISIQHLLELSMAQNEIMFDQIPSSLIIQAPYDGKTFINEKSIIPLKTINISHLLLNNFKKCIKCNEMALYQCKKCVESNRTVLRGLYCESHMCLHKEILQFPISKFYSQSYVFMNLKALISIENRHASVYTKEDDFTNEWIFYDSQPSINIKGNCSAPVVHSLEQDIMDFLNKENNEIMTAVSENNILLLKDFTQNLKIFIYENSSLSCY